MIVAPLESRTVVFNKGTSKGLIGITSAGGQKDPDSTLGLKDAWKKDQKNEAKKKISLTMNNNTPRRILFSTCAVCFPCSVASRLTSRHHWTTESNNKIIPQLTRLPLISN